MPRHARSALRLTALAAVAALATAAAPAGAALPDGRAFERVTPQDTGRVDAFNSAGGRSLVVDDDTFIWQSGAQPATATPSGYGAPTYATRTSTGWSNAPALRSATPPDRYYNLIDATNDGKTLVLAYSSSVFLGIPPDGQNPTGVVYRGPDGIVRPVAADDGPNGATGLTFYNGISADGGTVIYTSDRPAADVPAEDTDQHVYRWTPAGVTRVAAAAGDPLAGCALDAGLDATFSSFSTRRANGVSADAATVFVKVVGGPGCAVGQLYRTGPGGSEVISRRPNSNTNAAGSFIGATPDGDSAFFATTADLTADASDTNARRDIYRWDDAAGGPTWTCISCGATGGITSAQLTRAFPSRDGRTLWFPATGLIRGQGVAGQERMFVERGGEIRAASFTPESSVAGITPDGSHVVLQATRGGQIVRATASAGSGVVTTDVSGGRPARIVDVTATLEGPTPRGASGLSGQGGHVISDDGSTIAFTAPSGLPGTDANDLRVYRWTSRSTEEITATNRNQPGPLLSPSGRTMFLYSDRSLTADSTQDGISTLFAARVGGGFPTPAVPSPACVGDGCRPPTGPPPTAGPAPTSSAPAVVGNATPSKSEPTPRVTLTRLSAGARRTFARTGRGAVKVRASRTGRVTVEATAKLGKKTRRVARGSARTTRSNQTVSLKLRLSAAARAQLRRTRRLRVTIAVSSPGARTVRQSLTLSIPGRG